MSDTLTRLRHAPTDWEPGVTRVVDSDGEHGTFIGNTEPAVGVAPHGWLGVQVRFDGDAQDLDVDPGDLTVTGRVVAPGLATRLEEPDGTGLDRYQLVHTASGGVVCGPATTRCAAHMDTVVEIVTAVGVDWAQPASTVLAGLDYMALYDQLRAQLGLCFDPETAKARRCPGENV